MVGNLEWLGQIIVILWSNADDFSLGGNLDTIMGDLLYKEGWLKVWYVISCTQIICLRSM